MRNSLETRLGVFFALALIVAFIVMEAVGSLDFLKRGVRVRALFKNIQELTVGDPVKMAGVPIGRVERIQLTNGQVAVTLKLANPDNVRTDSRATVKFTGLLGQNFVAISFGSATAPRIDQDALLETTEQTDFSALMTKLESVASGVDNLTKSLTGDSLQNLVGPIVDFVRENSPRLSGVVSNMQTISTRIVEGQGTVGKLINEDALHQAALHTVTNLDATVADVRLTLDEARSVVTRINEGQGTLGKLTRDEALYQETTAAMTNLREILQKINQGQGTVGKLVNEDTFYKNARLSLQKLDKATESLEDQGPLSVLGMAVGSLF
jgi:phospholipid/cholesterol/gamma-HCH transport system substrate-binding protein